MSTQVKLTARQMQELLDYHMHTELEANIEGLMSTLADKVCWGRDDDENKLVGRDAIRAHYEGILAPGRHDARRVRGWYDEAAQSSATEYNVTINFDDGNSLTFPLIACVEFDNGKMRNEVLYFYEGRAPSQLLPQEMLVEQGESFMKAKALSAE